MLVFVSVSDVFQMQLIAHSLTIQIHIQTSTVCMTACMHNHSRGPLRLITSTSYAYELKAIEAKSNAHVDDLMSMSLHFNLIKQKPAMSNNVFLALFFFFF